MQRFIEVLSQINNDPDFTKEEKIEIINRAFENYRNQIDNDYKNYAAKQYLGAILEIGAAGLPMGGAGKLGVQYIGKPLTKYIGRKIAQNIGSGIAAGGASAGLFGVGNGLINEKNPIFTGLQAIPEGMVFGGAVGGIVGKLEQLNQANKLKNAANNPNRFNLSNKYYQNYEQGKNIKLNKIGNIKLSSDGFKETNIQNPEYYDKVINLTKNLQNAQYIGTELPKHPHKYPITQFHRLRGKNTDYLIAENEKGNKYFHKVADPALSGPKPEAQGLPLNIIPNSIENINPVSENITLSGYISKDNQSLIQKIIDRLKGKPTGYRAPTELNDFTRNIGQEENFSLLFKQSTQSPYSQKNQTLFDYINPLTSDNRIFTREDIDAMTGDEFAKHEKEIMSQTKAFNGQMPTNYDMQKEMSAGRVIYVNAYTRADGTQVKGYYRSRNKF